MGVALTVEKWAENLSEVTLSRWLAQVGDTLAVGDSLCEIITDKATFEYEMEDSGVLLRTYVAPKSVVPLGTVLAYVGEAGEEPPADIETRNEELQARHQAAARLTVDLDDDLTRRALAAKAVRATPAARRLAREQGLDLAQIAAWTGSAEALSEADVARYISEAIERE